MLFQKITIGLCALSCMSVLCMEESDKLKMDFVLNKEEQQFDKIRSLQTAQEVFTANKREVEASKLQNLLKAARRYEPEALYVCPMPDCSHQPFNGRASYYFLKHMKNVHKKTIVDLPDVQSKQYIINNVRVDNYSLLTNCKVQSKRLKFCCDQCNAEFYESKFFIKHYYEAHPSAAKTVSDVDNHCQ